MIWSNLRIFLIVWERRTGEVRGCSFRLKRTKLNYRFHNPNSAEDTADFLCKLLIEVNAGKVERGLHIRELIGKQGKIMRGVRGAR